MLWWSAPCLSLAYHHPNRIQGTFFQREPEESEPWAYGDMGTHPVRYLVRAEPATVHPSPRSHRKPHGLSSGALRTSCWHPPTFVTLTLPPSLEIQFPPPIWHINHRLSTLHPNPSSFLPFATAWRKVTTGAGARAGCRGAACTGFCSGWAGSRLQLKQLLFSQFKTGMTVASDFHPGNANLS